MEGESNQSMKQEQKERKKKGRKEREAEETRKKEIADGGVFVSFDFRATG